MFDRIKMVLHRKYKLLSKNGRIIFWIVKTVLFFPRKDVVLISFYADYDVKERYKKAADNLSAKLKKWRIPHVFKQVIDKGGYKNNTLFKPTFIQNQIDELKKTVIWIDCDTDPSSPEVIYKMATMSKPFCCVSEFGDRSNMQVWILKFNYTCDSLDLLNFWSKYCLVAMKRDVNELDHEALRDSVLPEYERKINVGYLKVNSKKVGYRSSTTEDKDVEIFQKSLIGETTRIEIVEEVKKLI